MSRQKRDLATSEWFHVTARGADRQDIFPLGGDHDMFLQIVAETLDDTTVSLHAYALMTNHYHLLLHAPGQSLSHTMQRIGARYGSAHNQRTKRTGPLFERRFHSVPITDDAQLLQCGRYVHLNPKDIVGPTALAAFPWSSLGVYLGFRASPSWLDTSRLAPLIDTRTYLDELRTPHPDDLVTRYGPPLMRCDLETLASAIRVVTGVDPRRQRAISRPLFVATALLVRIDHAMAIAEWLSVTPNAVRKAGRVGRIEIDTDPTMRRRYDAVLRVIAATGTQQTAA